MRKILPAVSMILLASVLASAGTTQTPKDSHPRSHIANPHPMHPDAEVQITALLKQFLANVTDPAMHARFWADDLMYVSATGALRNKQGIVNSIRTEAERAAAGNALPVAQFSAEDITVRTYGSVAVVNFTLVERGPIPSGSRGPERIKRYRDSGVFQLNKDGWQAVSWQSTPIALAQMKR